MITNPILYFVLQFQCSSACNGIDCGKFCYDEQTSKCSLYGMVLGVKEEVFLGINDKSIYSFAVRN